MSAVSVKLSDIPLRCFQGVIPAVIATSDRSGIPNVTYLSQVFYLDEKRVALSCQFFNKTKKNVLENPYASVEIYDPQTIDVYRIVLRYDHAETDGPIFEKMSAPSLIFPSPSRSFNEIISSLSKA